MRGQDFAGQDLRNAKLQGQDLRNCRFVDCDMRGANLEGANLSHADLTGADLTDARMLGAIMVETIGAVRNGGPVVSVVGLPYPILLDGKVATFGCESVPLNTAELHRSKLLRMDKAEAVRFYAAGEALVKWYRGRA